MDRNAVPSAALVIATVAYGWNVTRQIKTLAELCREQRVDIQKLTVTYQEKVVPALAEVDTLLRTMRDK